MGDIVKAIQEQKDEEATERKAVEQTDVQFHRIGKYNLILTEDGCLQISLLHDARALAITPKADNTIVIMPLKIESKKIR